MFDANIVYIIVIRKLFPVILDDLSLENLFFLRIKLFFNEKFRSPIIASRILWDSQREKKFSNKWSLVNRSLSPI